MFLWAGQWAAPKPQLGADPRPAGPGRAAPGSPRSPAPRAQDRPAPRRRAPRTRLPTVWLASCFMRLNCFFMAAAARRRQAAGLWPGRAGGLSRGSYIASRPGRRRRSLQFGPALAASLPARPPAPSARPTEWSRAEPNKAETRGVESSRCERTPRWVELSQSGRRPVRPREGGWGQAERVRNQIGGAELCRSEPGRNQRSLA